MAINGERGGPVPFVHLSAHKSKERVVRVESWDAMLAVAVGRGGAEDVASGMRGEGLG